jgi:hypothetical protein
LVASLLPGQQVKADTGLASGPSSLSMSGGSRSNGVTLREAIAERLLDEGTFDRRFG